MKRSELKKELELLLGESKSKFDNLAKDLHLDIAAADLPRVRPLTIYAELELVAGTATYAAPSDLLNPLYLQWAEDTQAGIQPWEDNWPGKIPSLSLIKVGANRLIQLSPPPTATQISVLGSTADYLYTAKYVIGDSDETTNIPDDARHLLLIRALASAMQSLANTGVTKPVTMGGKAGISLPRNGTPQALADELMDLFERMA